MMQYIVIRTDLKTGESSAFSTSYYQYENHYDSQYKMVVIDLSASRITFDGVTWQDIEEDHL